MTDFAPPATEPQIGPTTYTPEDTKVFLDKLSLLVVDQRNTILLITQALSQMAVRLHTVESFLQQVQPTPPEPAVTEPAHVPGQYL